MADFCKRCSEEVFGRDFGDLAGLTDRADVFPVVICEGCGIIQVDAGGRCVSADCLHKHGVAVDES